MCTLCTGLINYFLSQNSDRLTIVNTVVACTLKGKLSQCCSILVNCDILVACSRQSQSKCHHIQFLPGMLHIQRFNAIIPFGFSGYFTSFTFQCQNMLLIIDSPQRQVLCIMTILIELNFTLLKGWSQLVWCVIQNFLLIDDMFSEQRKLERL